MLVPPILSNALKPRAFKYDGFRALLEIDEAGARLVSRNRNRFKHLDPLAAALAKRLRSSGFTR